MLEEGDEADLLLVYRGVELENQCGSCGGWGIRVYPNTATWRGGCGGMTLTLEACDLCWGSGDKNRRWPSHRLLETYQR
jgi:hypothetical protein